MPFSDEDLERLKVFIASHDKGRTVIGQDFIVESKLLSLLHRLECAEKLVAWEWDKGNYQELLGAWLRSKGGNNDRTLGT